jgi:hypothetical protein
MVEGVVAIPFFILMLAGTVFVGGFYRNRLEAQNKARFETWKRAVNDNCDSGSNGDLPGLEQIDSADLGELSKTPLAALCDRDVGAVNYTARDSFAVTGAFPFSKEITATVNAPCNETPVAGDVAYEKAVEFLWDAYEKQGVMPSAAGVPSVIDWAAILGYTGGVIDPMAPVLF